MELVTLPTMEEKATKEKKSTRIDIILSYSLRALTSIEAGVNCVKLQCKEVRYFQAKSEV